MIDFHCDNCEFLQDKSNDNIIDGYCKKYNQSLTFYDWFEKCDKCLIETLQSENAALRERLEKARIKERGEVFTAEREVKAMCDLIPEKIMKEWERYND